MQISVALALVSFAAPVAGAHSILGYAACVTHADTTAWPLEMATHAVVDTDSASLVADNLPLGVDTVTVVADEQVCAAVVAAYNGLIPAVDSAHRINRAVVMQAGPIFVMALPPERRGHRHVLYFFTSSFHFITRHEWTD